MSQRLTLNMGLRHDLYTPFVEAHNLDSNFDQATGQTVIAGQNGYGNTAGVKTDDRSVAPRLGFAYTPIDGTVIRGGFG